MVSSHIIICTRFPLATIDFDRLPVNNLRFLLSPIIFPLWQVSTKRRTFDGKEVTVSFISSHFMAVLLKAFVSALLSWAKK